MAPARLILASASSTRRQILAAAGVDFDVIPAEINESEIISRHWEDGATKLARRLAIAKARAVSEIHPEALVLGGDQILTCGGELYEKVADPAAARARLLLLRGREHALHGAAALVRGGNLVWDHGQACRLYMRTFSDAFLDGYMKRAGAALLSSVGSYAYEGLGGQLFDRVDGDFHAILGLPLLPVLEALRREGVINT